jgi:hypothetical protein
MVRKGRIDREGMIEKADRTDKTNRAKNSRGKMKRKNDSKA